MINPEELVRRPVRERDLLPVATDTQTIQYFQERIESISKHVVASIRGPHLVPSSSRLLQISGGEEYSLIGETYSTVGRRRIERGRAQDLLFKAMTAYGFDENISHPRLRHNPFDLEKQNVREDITVRPDGTTREALIYPSQTIKGLSFERLRDSVPDTGATTGVLWYAVDESLLWFRIDISNIFSRNRKPKPQIFP